MPAPPNPPTTGAITTTTITRRDGTQIRGYFSDDNHFRVTAVSAGINGQATNNFVDIARTDPPPAGVVFEVGADGKVNFDDAHLGATITPALATSRTRAGTRVNQSVGNQLESYIMGADTPSNALAAMVGNGGPGQPLTGLNLLLSNTRNGANLIFPVTGVAPAIANNNQAKRAMVASRIAEWYSVPANQNMDAATAKAALKDYLMGTKDINGAALAGPAQTPAFPGITDAEATAMSNAMEGQHLRIRNALRTKAANPASTRTNNTAPAITVPIGLPPQLGGPEPDGP